MNGAHIDMILLACLFLQNNENRLKIGVIFIQSDRHGWLMWFEST